MKAPDVLRCAGPDAVTQALAVVTACLVDPNCVLEGSDRATSAIDTMSDEEHGSMAGASNFMGLKLGLAASLLAITVGTSYLPLAFMWSPHYNVRLLENSPILPSGYQLRLS